MEQQPDSISRIDKGSMKRILGVRDLFAVGYGDLGSSIFYALGITAFFALGATPIALMIAGVVFACTALTYAEMSSVIFEAGGSASYLRKAFNDLVSFVAGWALLLDFIVTIAISSFAVGPYLQIFFPSMGTPLGACITAIVVILSLTVLNIVGVHHSTRFSIVLSFLAIVTQALIIATGIILLVHFPTVFEHMKIGVEGSPWSPTWGGFWKGVAMAMVAYTGIESMAQLTAEAKNPSKTVPRAIMWAMGTLLILYMGVSVVALSAMTPEQLGHEYVNNPMAGIVAKIPVIGPFLKHWIGILGAIILIVACNAGLIGASRLSFNLGEYYQLPRFFYTMSKKRKTPWVSLIVFAVFASLIIIWSRGKLSFMADLYNFGAMLAFTSAHLALIMHRYKHPDAHRPFRIPFNFSFFGRKMPVTPILGALATFSVWILVLITKPEGRDLGLVWLLLGVPMYLWYRRKHKLAPMGQVEIRKVKIDDYKKLGLKQVLVPTRGGAETETVQIACQIAKSLNASVTAVHIIEVPFAFPLHSRLFKKPQNADAILHRAEAIGREYGVPVNLKQIVSRSVAGSLVELVDQEEYDLLVVGAPPNSDSKNYPGLSTVTDRLLSEVSCRVWVCRGVAEACELRPAGQPAAAEGPGEESKQ